MSLLMQHHGRRTFITRCLGGLALASTTTRAAQAVMPGPVQYITVRSSNVSENKGEKIAFKIYLNETHYHDAVPLKFGSIGGWSRRLSPAAMGTLRVRLEIQKAQPLSYSYFAGGEVRDPKSGRLTVIEAKSADGSVAGRFSIDFLETTERTNVAPGIGPYRHLQLTFWRA